MRRISDSEGNHWDVVVGRESYGMQVYLFMPVDGGGIRKALMAADTRLDGEQELEAADSSFLQDRLAMSVPWEDNALF
ncbi:MAG: hypothetical protein R6V11_07465 [Ectothiorhodospiraceae bacterium]